jgi:ATP-binding cassette, subfamily B, bacterial
VIRFLYGNLRGRRWMVSAAVGLTIIGSGADILSAFPLKFILDKIVHHIDPPNFPIITPFVNYFDQFGTRNGLTDTEVHTQLGVILFAGAMLLLLGVVSALVSYVQLAVAAFVAQDLGARLRDRLFTHLEHLALAWHGRQRVGDLVQRVSGNVTDVEKLVTDGLVDLLSGVLTLTGILLVMFLLNWQFTLLSMVVLPPLVVVITGYTRWIKRASKQSAKALGEVAEVATEGVGAITEVKAFTLERWLGKTFSSRVERRRRFGWRAGRRQAEFDPLVLTLVTLSSVAIITVGAWIAFGHGHRYAVLFLAIPANSITVGTLTVFLSYSRQLYSPLRSLSKLMLLASTASSAAERIQEVLDQPLEDAPKPEDEESKPEEAAAAAGRGFGDDLLMLPEKPATCREEPRPVQERALADVAKSFATRPLPTPARRSLEVRGDVVYRGVTFGYEVDRPVLHGIDLEVPVGKRVALVGLSGSGKTTMVRLLPRLYELWAGSITIDGIDIRELPRDELRHHIGIVLQDSILFEGTIRDNIVLNLRGISEEQLHSAARQACIHDTIMEMPDGYDAKVRELGKNFSSGQRQRMAIARAILRDAPILILDEPTANLDVEAEAEVMRAVERLTANRTVIVISHRLSTLGHVDEIAVLEHGHIVERGTYQELKMSGGSFARLLAEQNRYAAEPVLLPEAVESNGHHQPAFTGSPRSTTSGTRRQ